MRLPALISHLGWAVSLIRTGHGRRPGVQTAAALILVQLLPLVFLLAAVLSLVATGLRARWVEHHYELRPADPAAEGEPPTIDEMQRFLTEQAPGTELRVTVRQDLPARVYPGGWRTARVGVFSPLVSLWKRDREAAEAVLHHEIGHLRNGEQHVAGLGSPFTGLVRAWPYVFAVFGLLPVILLFASGNPTAPLMSAQIVLVVVSVPKNLLIVVGALWSAELAADRYAARTAGSAAQTTGSAAQTAKSAAQQRALREGTRTSHGVLARLYHPPVRMRLWFIARSEQPPAQLLLVLLWPAAMLTGNLLDLSGGALAFWLLGDTTADDATRRAVALSRAELVSGPVWWAILGAITVWPLLTRRWARLWGWHGRAAAGTLSPTVYATSGLLPVLVLVLGLLPVGPTPGERPQATSRSPHATVSTGSGLALPTPCPSRSRPAPPSRPAGLPSFEALRSNRPTSDTAPTGDRMRSLRTLHVVSTSPLLGSPAQAQDVADRLAHAHWTLGPDGTLTADGADLPVLGTTAVQGGTRLLHGERTRTTDVSATTTWLDARLSISADGTVRLDLIHAATGVTHAVVACRAFDSTVTAAARLVLRLQER
ncbi:M48 family metalloprotease [Streptomyces sp. YIM S03343]